MIAPEGKWICGLSFLISISLLVLFFSSETNIILNIFLIVSIIETLFCLYFFRDPKRDVISSDKKMVRGDEKWYVDFDKCLPYFVESHTCGICLAVCPWSRPDIADNLLKKFVRKSNSA